jgi:hypothetical protein
MRLAALAHARSGDKGDTSQISVIAYDPADYPWLCAQLTVERVAAHFGPLVEGPIRRYELPALAALNFVFERALGGGVTRALTLDAHGKCLSGVLLALELPDPQGRGG